MTFRVDPAVIQASAKARSDVYPYAVWMPIKEATTQPRIVPRLLILHSQAGPAMTSLEALHKYVNRDDVHIEPTFILDMSGRMAQLVGILTRADCSAQANPFSTAVETQDQGAGTLARTPWTPEQCEQLAGLAAFEHLHPDIRLSLVPATTWNGQGVGGHRKFPQWSIYVGKTCPGDARMNQIDGIIQRAIEIADWQPEKPQPETPEKPAERENLMIGIIRIGSGDPESDSFVPEAHAQFIGYYVGDGRFLAVKWISTQAQIEARDHHKAGGAKYFAFPKHVMKDTWVDKVPEGDGLTVWSEEHFAGVG